jgi:Protein of unknown function (DUF2505)
VEFVLEQRLDATPDEVLDVLLDREFLAARSGLAKLRSAELLELSRDDHSAHVRVRMQFAGDLSAAVTAVVDPSKLTWVDDAVFVLGSREARHEIQPDHYADRLACEYDDVLLDDQPATKRTLTGWLKVRAPLVGGRVERAIVSGLREYAASEAVLIDQWLRR